MFPILRNLGGAISASILALYLSFAIGGKTFHQLQHIVTGSVCSSDDRHHVASFNSATHESAQQNSSVCATDGCNVTIGQTDAPNPEQPAKDHSESDCWTCLLLAQTGDLAQSVQLLDCQDSLFIQTEQYNQPHLDVIPSGFLVRGPPASLLLQS